MSTKRKKRAEADERLFVDRYGHQYHSLAWGIDNASDEKPDVLVEIVFSRVPYPTDGGDTHEFMITIDGHTEILERAVLIEIITHGWNGELMNLGRLKCEDPSHQYYGWEIDDGWEKEVPKHDDSA